LADLYSFADVFVYPSLYEGFGIPPLEAMSCGCPVICSDRSSLPEVVGEAVRFFDPESIDSLTDALNQVVSDSSLRRALINKGHLRSAEFSWSKCADETLKVYKRLMLT
jgi:glycosyltransferase involved in cell wall biosynthesis